MSTDNQRQGHATLDLRTREAKGRKIERLLHPSPPRGGRLLEVGTGAGGIAHYFATRSNYAFDVDAVDVDDRRQVTEGYRFTPVDSTTLPFANGIFDVAVSNHVIEHVGDREAQLHHLQEIRRVLKPSGLLYLAVPNRWMLVEPHFRLPFLSWLPRGLRSPYVRLMRRGPFYDCEPLQRFEVEKLASDAGFRARNVSVQAFRTLAQVEGVRGLAALVAGLPDALLHRLEPIIPTHIYLLDNES